MKKLFTLKNCLIILLLLSITIYFSICNIQEFDNIQLYNRFIESNVDTSTNSTYLLNIKACIATISTNFIISAMIIAFIILFCISAFKQINFLKFAFITLLFTCFFTYMIQVDIPWFMMFNNLEDINPSYLIKAITALIALLISITCYVYLLVKEIQKHKAKQLDPTTEQDTTQA